MIQIIPADPHPLMTPSPVKVIAEVKKLDRVKPAKPVEEHTPSEYTPGVDGQPERRHGEPLREERRTYCRRIKHQPVLEELRSSEERRRHKQRGTDITEHIDEEV